MWLKCKVGESPGGPRIGGRRPSPAGRLTRCDRAPRDRIEAAAQPRGRPSGSRGFEHPQTSGRRTARRGDRGPQEPPASHPTRRKARRAEQGLDDEKSAHFPVEALADTGVDECLCKQEDISGSRARQPGHRVELVLGKASDNPERGQHALGPFEVVLGHGGATGEPDARAPSNAGVLGIARRTTTPRPSQVSSWPIVRPATMESTRWQPDPAMVRHPAWASAGLTARTADSTATPASVTTTPGKRLTSPARALPAVPRRPARQRRPSSTGGAHL